MWRDGKFGTTSTHFKDRQKRKVPVFNRRGVRRYFDWSAAKNSQPSKSASSVDTLNRICEILFSCTHADKDALIGAAKNTGKGTEVMPGKAFLAVEFQFSRLLHKIMIKNSVLTTQRQMDLLNFAISSTVARTPHNLDTRYSALYGYREKWLGARACEKFSYVTCM